MLGGQAAYDLMVKNIPGMNKPQPNEPDVNSDINGLAFALTWKPSLDEVEHDSEGGVIAAKVDGCTINWPETDGKAIGHRRPTCDAGKRSAACH